MANEPLRHLQKSYGSMGGEIGFAGASSAAAVFDEIEFNRLGDSITHNLFQIVKHASNLERTLKTIGTKNDTDALRDSVHTVTTTAMKSINETTKTLKSLTAMMHSRTAAENKGAKLRLTKLTSDFKDSVQKFTDTQKQIVTKMKITVPYRSNFGESTDEQQSLVDVESAQQAQLQYQQHLEFEQGLLLERENRLRRIEADILDVNDIMKELATLVVDQRTAVDSIEENIEAAHTQVETGRTELQKAETYQSKYRKRLFCLLVTGAIVVIIVIVVLVIELKK